MGSLGQATLLAVAIVCSCFLQTQAQGDTISITLIPPNPIQGESITLRPEGVPENLFSCSWFRAATTDSSQRIITYYPSDPNASLKGPAYTWRETVNPDCSLLISNLSANYSGNYTTQWSRIGIDQTGTTSFNVSEKLLPPFLWSPGPLLVPENENVTLHCNTSERADVEVSWFWNGGPAPAGFKRLDNNRTLSVSGITRKDAGNYSCMASKGTNNATSNLLTITVAYGPDGVVMNQTGTVYAELGSRLVLSCFTFSVPEAQFGWFFNNTDQNRTTDTFGVELKAWEDQGNYTCQASNHVSGLTASTTVYLWLFDPKEGGQGCSNCLSSGQIAGIVIGTLAGVALIAGGLYFICTKTSLGRTEQQKPNGNITSAPGHNQGVTDSKPTSGEEDLQYSTLAFNASNPRPQPNPVAAQPLDSSIIYSEIKKK